jgi:predicted small secreted protein
MITIAKCFVALLVVIALAGLVGVGCNTAHGFGKDVSNVGNDIQNDTK